MSDWASLAFADRQRLWNGGTRTFRQNNGRGERPTVWEIWVEKDRVFTRHGLLDGQMQETNYVGKVKNKGRSNEVSTVQDAIAEARRDVRKKWDFEGYDEYIGNQNIDCRNENVSVNHLLAGLPGSFSLYKPKNEIENEKRLFTLANQGKALFTLKRDGVAMWIIVDYYGNIQMYSRRNRPWSDTEEPAELPDGTLDFSTAKPWSLRFPHIIEAVRQLNLPYGTMLAGELVAIDPKTGKDSLRIASGYTKGHTETSLESQKGNPPSYYIWDIPFYNGTDLVRTVKVSQRYELITELMDRTPPHYNELQGIQVFTFPNVAEALAEADRLKIEGWVVVDPEAVYDDKGWNLKGKPDRPSSCAKAKPTGEDDFIAFFEPEKGKTFSEWGTGKHEAGKTVTLPNKQQAVHGGIGAIGLYQYNSKGELVFISKCGGGMKYEYQANLRRERFPFVCKVEYKGRTYISEGEDTNALRHPVFVEERTDKTPEECINPLL